MRVGGNGTISLSQLAWEILRINLTGLILVDYQEYTQRTRKDEKLKPEQEQQEQVNVAKIQ